MTTHDVFVSARINQMLQAAFQESFVRICLVLAQRNMCYNRILVCVVENIGAIAQCKDVDAFLGLGGNGISQIGIFDRQDVLTRGGILGGIDGFASKGIEAEDDIKDRLALVRAIGYKQ